MPIDDLNDADWWREAVIYQIYPKSFADSNGDGTGDLLGVINRLDYLAELGVDAIWFSPWYPTPDKDGGYDVADYKAIKAEFGNLADAKALIDAAHARGIKVIIDIVPNHCSDEHEWFQRAMQTAPPSKEWDYFHVLPGTAAGGPPNGWKSLFGGSAWEEICFEGKPTGYYYLHIFDKGQPDLNWENPAVHAEFENILRFWFDLGIDGFRVDVAHGLYKATGYPEHSGEEEIRDAQGALLDVRPLPFFDQPEVHAVYRKWRAIANEYSPARMFVAEAWVPTVERLAKYLRKDELHSGFNFGFLMAGWDFNALRANIENSMKDLHALGVPATWVVENHDTPRIVTRFGVGSNLVHHPDSGDPTDINSSHYIPTAAELEIGIAKSRSMIMLLAGLPGSLYIYQGQELGLDEIRDIPAELRQDPIFKNPDTPAVGRDGCRVPLPWESTGRNLGFNHSAESAWLPMPQRWSELSVEVQLQSKESILNHYRNVLRLRKELGLGAGELTIRSDIAGDGLLVIERSTESGAKVLVCINFTDKTMKLPDHAVLFKSFAGEYTNQLPAFGAVWLSH